jgi:hypothetical protein
VQRDDAGGEGRVSTRPLSPEQKVAAGYALRAAASAIYPGGEVECSHNEPYLRVSRWLRERADELEKGDYWRPVFWERRERTSWGRDPSSPTVQAEESAETPAPEPSNPETCGRHRS